MRFISVILKGSVTCRKPLGSFSLITSRQYSISPVVCLNFTVQWDIWSRTTWDKMRKKEKENESMVCPVAGLLGNTRTNCQHPLWAGNTSLTFYKKHNIKIHLYFMFASSSGWMCVPSSSTQSRLPLHDAHVHTDAHTHPPKPILPKWIKLKTLHLFKFNQNVTDPTEEMQSHLAKPLDKTRTPTSVTMGTGLRHHGDKRRE